MMNNKFILGALLAVLAAILNATVGIISVSLFEIGMKPASIAFYKCLIALVILLSYTFLFKFNELKTLAKNKCLSISICSFFGLFCLYFFETAAYRTVNVAVVVFLLFGASTITTFLLNAILEKRFLYLKELLSSLLAVVGLALIFSPNESQSNNMGLYYAVISGIGYGVFLTLSKKFEVGSNMGTLTLLLAFGCIYLFIPFAFNGLELISIKALPIITLLAILPTIGGFYCTLKALSLIKSQSVQLIELTEPVFAILFSFIFLGQLSTLTQLVGGAIILFAIVLYEFSFKSAFKEKQANESPISESGEDCLQK